LRQNVIATGNEECIGGDDEPARPLLGQSCESGIDLRLCLSIQHVHLQSERAHSILCGVIRRVQQMVRVDLRVVVDEVPPQDVISRDNVSVKVNAVIYFRVVDAERAVIQVNNYLVATSQLAQTTLRWVLGKHDLDAMLAERDKLNADIQDVLDKQTEAWGIKVSTVEIKRIDLNESMVRAIARQAEAERTRRAKIINAEGEQQAAQKLLDAARILAPVPQAMQLRYLATLFDIAGERSSTIVFPMPIDLMKTWAGQAPAEGG
jgi:regulator of protease activity HflC (stomatin/prohibitin superfamily)